MKIKIKDTIEFRQMIIDCVKDNNLVEKNYLILVKHMEHILGELINYSKQEDIKDYVLPTIKQTHLIKEIKIEQNDIKQQILKKLDEIPQSDSFKGVELALECSKLVDQLVKNDKSSIKIKKENVTLYANMAEGLEQMKQTTISK